MDRTANDDNSKNQMTNHVNLNLSHDLSKLITMQVENSSEIEVLSSSNDEFVFALQDMDDGTQLFYDMEKEQNINVDEYSKIKFLEHPCPKGSLTVFRDEKLKKYNAQVYKKIEKLGFGPTIDLSLYKVVYEYSFFLEDTDDPLDSSRFKKNLGTIHFSKDLFTLAGIQDAIMTMKYNEESLFWISNELMYGSLGVKPRIPPKADFLARIKISKLFDNDGNEIKLKISKFEETLHSASKAYSVAKMHFNKNDFTSAIAVYRKWINTLENLHLADDEQENETKQYLTKMYLNMCVCYNKIENPQKTCLAMRELERLTSIANSPKALFAKGKALMMLNHDGEAQHYIEAALKFDPKNQKILDTLKELKSIRRSKKEYSKNMNEFECNQRDIDADLHGKKCLIDKFLQSLPN